MRRSTLAVLTLAMTAAALASCGQRQSLYLDSGRAESNRQPPRAAAPPHGPPAAAAAQPPPSGSGQPSRP